MNSNNMFNGKPLEAKSWISINTGQLTVLLMLLLAITNISESIYTPALTSMAHYFQVSKSEIQHTINAFMLGFGMGQLFWGPLSDKFGRKIILLIGLSLFFLATLICAQASTIKVLYLARFIQGFAGCAASVMTRTIARDLFPFQQRANIFSRITAFITICWLLSPFIGGLILTLTASWRFIFWLLACYSLCITLTCAIALPESNVNRLSRNTKTMNVITYIKPLFQAQYIFHCLIGGLLLSVSFIYLFNAPFILMKQWHLSSISFGITFIFTSGGAALGAIIANRLRRTLAVKMIILLGLIICFSLSLLLFALVMLNQLNIYGLVIIITSIMMASMMAKSNISVIALDTLERNIGLGSSVLGMTQMLLATIITYAMTLLHVPALFILSDSMIAVTLIGVIIYLYYLFQEKTQ